MMFPIILILSVLLCWSGIADSRVTGAQQALTNTTDLANVLPVDSSLNSLEDALSVLNNLTLSQKLMWEQQQLREEEIRKKTQSELDREAERTRAMQEEFRILQEMKGKVNRKLKAMSKPVLLTSNEQGGTSANLIHPRDCADIYLDAEETSGVYRIWPTWDTEGKGYLVYCDMDTDGGGWTVIRRWGNSGFSSSFYKKTWLEYKKGFGDIRYDFWLGNELIHTLTNQAAYEVRFEVQSEQGNISTTYRRFWTDGESSKYTAHAEDNLNSSTAGNLFDVHNSAPFSASDMNNIKRERDRYGNFQSSAPECSFGWWFNANCNVSSFLDPKVRGSGQRDMKIRPVGFSQLREST